MTHFWTIGAHLGAQISPFGTPQMANIPYKATKMHCTFGDHPDGASSDIWDQIWLFWAYDDLFRGQKAGFVTIGGAKGISLLIKLPFWGHQKGPSGPKMGQECL